MSKHVTFSSAARDRLKVGVNTLADAVGSTLGPSGRNVIVQKSYGAPMVTKDGVSVATSITPLEDPLENIGAKLAQEVASQTNNEAGDGTTTATVLAQAIFNEGHARVASGANPVMLKMGIDKGTAAVVEEIKKFAKPVKGPEAENVAQISANDKALGTTIYEALKAVGDDGIVTVEESKTLGIETEVVNGMRIDQGFVSAHMTTDGEKRLTAEYTEPLVFVTDMKLTSVQDVLPVAEAALGLKEKNLVIVCEGVEGEALTTLVVNKIRGVFNALVVKAPGFGDNRKEMLQDIAILTGATLYTSETGMKFDNVKPEEFGRARRVVSTKDHTTIIGLDTHKDAISTRIETIKEELAKAESQFDKDKFKERLGKLAGGIGVIKVGAATEPEVKEIKQRVEDALAATKAAVAEGVVPGGGVTLLRCAHVLDEIETKGMHPDTISGIKILRSALEAPIRKISQNAGFNDHDVVYNVKNGKGAYGFNAATGEYEDLTEAGVIDPAKVTRLALQNATSIAGLLLMTEAVVTEIKDEKEPTI